MDLVAARIVLSLSPVDGSAEFLKWWNRSIYSADKSFTAADKLLAENAFAAALNIAATKLLET
jgi:hypothetical protein